jgi:plastocyanin
VSSDAPAAGSVPVAMENFAFGPEQIAIQSGEVALYLTNNDAARHTFTVDELGIDFSVAPGQSRLVRFDAAAGEYRFYCKPHEPGMAGTLVVQ